MKQEIRKSVDSYFYGITSFTEIFKMSNTIFSISQHFSTLLKRKAKKYLDDAKAIERHCQSMVLKHQACLNG